MTDNPFTSTGLSGLLGIEKPVISGGMVWCSGWRLAAAVSREGGLGMLGAGSMYPDVLREHIAKCRAATDKPFGVNIPLLYPDIEKAMEVICSERVPVVVTSAGNPATYTARLKDAGCKVMHVVSSSYFAVKAEQAGVDAVIAEGFEAGGHNGREETTTMVLVPAVVDAVSIPVVAAGGIASGRSILAAQALGAQGVQIGTLFALSEESSAHENFKRVCIEGGEGDTRLVLKKLVPTRLLLQSKFTQRVIELETHGAGKEELQQLLGRARAKKGIFEGDIDEGEIEIGQVHSMVTELKSVEAIFRDLEAQYIAAKERLLRG